MRIFWPSAASIWAEWDVARPWMTQSPRWWEQLVMAATKPSSSEIIQSYNIYTADVARPWMTQSQRWWEQLVMAATKLSSSEIIQSYNIYTADIARTWMTQSPRWEQLVMAATKLSSSEIIVIQYLHCRHSKDVNDAVSKMMGTTRNGCH